MATFDEVTTKAKEIIDSVSKKTGEFVGVQKLRIEAMDIKSKISKLYRELGEVVYTASIDDNDYTETIEDLIAAIEMKKNDLQFIQTQIDAKQNKRTCPSCGKTNDAKADYCSGCGEKLTISYSDEDFADEDAATADDSAVVEADTVEDTAD